MSGTTLGCTYSCKITGFSGIATGVVDYISGCRQVLIQPRVDKDGRPMEAMWIDEQRLELISEHTRVVLDNGTTPGFDKQAPIR